MKRSGSLKRSAPLKRKTELARGSARSLRRRARRVTNRYAAEAWARGIRGKPCAICGRGPSQGHHVVTQAQLRTIARSKSLDLQSLLWDHRNRLAVCEACHFAHHQARRRIPLAVLRRHCPKVFQFARELDVEWWLDREYPRESAAERR